MSEFTNRCVVMAVPRPVVGWLDAILPPSFQRPQWEVWDSFRYCVGSLAKPTDVIQVLAGFPFDGASVPWLVRFLVPMAHPNYIQATALHDFMLTQPKYTRRYCDEVFREALGVLGMPPLWRNIMFGAVRVGALRAAIRKRIKELRHAH
ncbi:MAG: DUF1353 domain-containing protein [Pseudomonadota bacterium]